MLWLPRGAGKALAHIGLSPELAYEIDRTADDVEKAALIGEATAQRLWVQPSLAVKLDDPAHDRFMWQDVIQERSRPDGDSPACDEDSRSLDLVLPSEDVVT